MGASMGEGGASLVSALAAASATGSIGVSCVEEDEDWAWA